MSAGIGGHLAAHVAAATEAAELTEKILDAATSWADRVFRSSRLIMADDPAAARALHRWGAFRMRRAVDRLLTGSPAEVREQASLRVGAVYYARLDALFLTEREGAQS